jgi:hypothetical protein
MAETLGSLCDKLTIVKLKQYHNEDSKRNESLINQELQLSKEINQFLSDAVSGIIPLEHLTFAANKIYKEAGNETGNVTGNFGEVFAELAQVNCELWHQQEKVYEFETVPVDQKDSVVKKLAVLNLQRNKCIDYINTIVSNLCGQQKF